MSASTIRDILYGIEQTLRERFRAVNDMLAREQDAPVTRDATRDALAERMNSLERKLEQQSLVIQELRNLVSRQELLPRSPMVGLEVTQRSTPDVKVVSITAEVQRELDMDESEVEGDEDIDVDAEAEAEVEATAEVEADAEVEAVAATVGAAAVEATAEAEEPEAEEEALEEFEYKGATYYRDSDNNVFTTNDDGELNDEPFGLWNPEKQRIVARR
jgi:hypothetical protein